MEAARLNPSSPILFQRKAAWNGIRLEHYRFRTGELPAHRGKEHLITIALGGNCHGEIRTASGFHTSRQLKGSVCIIPAGQSYQARLEGESEHLAMYIEPSLLLHAASASQATGVVEVVEKCAPSDPVISNVALALLAELNSSAVGETVGVSGRLYAESLANVLAVHLLRHYTAFGSDAPRFSGGLSGQRLRLVTEFIADNYGRDLSLADLAGAAGMSAFHFAREFKRTTGTTPHQYLIKFRIDRAKALLAEGKLPLVEVGFRSGFSHQSHFTRLFHRVTGTTPHSYRLMFQT
ncbi:MAG TPA: AraC family transcriptional regulator [Pyrinomonadaceae bacterium]|nr:AraC family transcriptional regulator [Pyrinomonadaceae bacterium]